MGEARYMKSCPLEHIHNPRYETLHLNHKWNTCIFYFFGLKLKAQNKAEEKKTAEHSISRFKTRAGLSSPAHSGPVLLLKKRRKAGSPPTHTHTPIYWCWRTTKVAQKSRESKSLEEGNLLRDWSEGGCWWAGKLSKTLRNVMGQECQKWVRV